MPVQIQTSYEYQWEQSNPVLGLGVPGWAQDTGVLKIGDGFTHWIDLPEVSKTALGALAGGQVVAITWNGTEWMYGGQPTTIRPTNRTDITCLFIDNIGTGTAPSFSQSGDLFIQKAS